MGDETIEERLFRLEYWRNGNGAKGAEQRIQQLEDHVRTKDEAIDLIKKVCAEGDFVTHEQIEGIIRDASTSAVHEVIHSAKTKDRTIVAKVKAWAPYVGALAAILIALIERGAK